MNLRHIENVLNRYLSDTASMEDMELLKHLLQDDEWRSVVAELLSKKYYSMPEELIIDKKNSLVKIRVFNDILATPRPENKIILWYKFAGVAVAILCLAFLLTYREWIPEYNSNPKDAITKVVPARNGATLTLSDGKKIRLNNISDGKIADESGISITKTMDGKLVYRGLSQGKKNAINTITTNRGEVYQLVLPDGSKVWMNAGSSLSYLAALVENGKRKVTLSGEAYFEVAKIPGIPFIVNSRDQHVQVLGTHFNISAYENSRSSSTTLLEGAILINDILLKPGERALQTGGKIKTSKVNSKASIDWVNGTFICEHESLVDIMDEISRWYDVDIIYEKPELKEKTFSGSLSRFSNVEDFLKILRFSGINCTIKNRTIFINK